ncbi:MAG: nicotinamide-nucleotide amidohydrolase family protein [Spirochaetaceae bacterium]|jgi:PncC family amidohydrolase|nr:nicotinamide-nucleotide amidohydrolase family protein [Spirochaetaceae bacterium]
MDAEAEELINRLAARSCSLAAAESCTAGLLADLLAQVPGASRVFWGSFVCYTVAAKRRMLGLDEALIRRHGAVSRETACAMVRGVLDRSDAGLAVSVTGLAGPGGDGSSVPVGTVWIGVMTRGTKPEASVFHYGGSRNVIRLSAARDALKVLLNHLT